MMVARYRCNCGTTKKTDQVMVRRSAWGEQSVSYTRVRRGRCQCHGGYGHEAWNAMQRGWHRRRNDIEGVRGRNAKHVLCCVLVLCHFVLQCCAMLCCVFRINMVGLGQWLGPTGFWIFYFRCKLLLLRIYCYVDFLFWNLFFWICYYSWFG